MQLMLAVGVEHYWPAVRDPDFNEIAQIIRVRLAEAPGRPLAVALGSSRTQMALAAARLNDSRNPDGPLLINAAVAGGGPMMHSIVLRRLLRLGQRPQMVFVEVMPMSLIARDGAPVEERQQYQARHTLGEVARLWTYYAERYRLCYPWAVGRFVPAYRYRMEMRQALGIDLPVGGLPARPPIRDGYGWTAPSPRILDRGSRIPHVRQPRQLCRRPHAAGARRRCACALRDVVQLCHDEEIGVVLFVPAEATAFRAACRTWRKSTSAPSETSPTRWACRSWTRGRGWTMPCFTTGIT